MKRISCLFLSLALILGITGCAAEKKPEDAVKSFMEAAKAFDFEAMAAYVNPDNVGDLESLTDESDSTELEQYFLDYLKESAAKITYEIGSAVISGDTATVTVTCNYVDSSEVLTQTISDFFIEALSAAFSGTELTDEQMNTMMMEIMEENKSSIEETYVDATIDVSCVKIDGVWYVDTVSDEMGDVITSNFLSASEEISSAFGE